MSGLNWKRESCTTDRNLPWRSALTLSKHSEPDDRSSTKGASKTETGLGCSDSLLLTEASRWVAVHGKQDEPPTWISNNKILSKSTQTGNKF